MRRFVTLFSVLVALQVPLAVAVAADEPITATSFEIPTLQTCTSLSSHAVRILRSQRPCHVNTEALAIWRSEASVEDLTSKFPMATLQTCAGKSSTNPSYLLIKSSCQKFQVATAWHRWLRAPSTPEIKSVVALNEVTALITFDQMNDNPDAPIAFFTVISHPDEVTTTGLPNANGQYYVTGLNEQKSYTFSVSATNADGVSPLSAASEVVTTPAIPVLVPAGPGLISFVTAAVLLFAFFIYRRFKSALHLV